MSFLKRGIKGEEPDPSKDIEEQYKRLMPKIGRDFVGIDDMREFLSALMAIMDPAGTNPLALGDSEARELAKRYQALVDKGKSGDEEKRDLIQPEKPEKEK